MAPRRQGLLLDGAADRDQRQERQRGVAMVLETGDTQKGGEMSVSEHANYLLNEYGRLQFDYAAYCKPYGESLRNEARNNLETYIAELEAENAMLKQLPQPIKFWSDEKKQIYKINESRTAKSGREGCGE